MDKNTIIFLKTLLKPYLEHGIERWFYIFGMNNNENNFVHIFSPYYSHKKFRNKHNQIDYVEYLTNLNEVLEKIRKAFANNWYICPAYFTSDIYRVETFGGTFWTFVDIDFKHYINVENEKETKEFAKKQMENIMVCDPDMIVFSGGGLHIYKQLDKMVTTKEEWLKEEAKLVECVKKIGLEPDPKVSNNHINILRIPGTINLRYKDGEKHRFVDLLYIKNYVKFTAYRKPLTRAKT